MASDETPKSDTEVLFPEVEVEGYKVRPWSFGDISDLSPVLSKVIAAVRANGIEFNTVETRIADIVPVVLQVAPELLAKTLKVKEEVVRAFSASTGAAILLTIISQNIDYLKNSLSLGSLRAKRGRGMGG